MAFDWKTNSDAICIERVDAIAVFKNGGGGITIMQEGTDEDAMVVVPVSRIKVLIKALKKAAEE